MNENDCPYQILGVSNDASATEIKKAYRKLALLNHPDKQTTEAAKVKAQTTFAKIANAYEILSDPEEREQYDLRKKYGGAPGTRYTTTKSPGASQPTYSGTPQYTNSSPQYSTNMPGRSSGGPSQTSYSQKDGKFTATVTREDGTTYTFMGSADGFQDPYEVFRKAFQDKTGEDLPDNMKPQRRSTKTSSPMMSSSSPTMQSTPTPVRSGTRTSTTINGNMKTITKTETLPDGRTRTSVEHVPIDSTPVDTTPTQRRTSTNNSITINGSTKTITKTETLPDGRTRTSVQHVPVDTPKQRRTSNHVPELVTLDTLTPVTTGTKTPVTNSTTKPSMMSKMKNPFKKSQKQPTVVKTRQVMMQQPTKQPMMMSSSGGAPQPMGRSQKTRQIQHPDGSIETVTEITETFSDGTSRTSTSSKFSVMSQ